MRTTAAITLLLSLIMLANGTSAAPAPEPLPTPDDLHQLFKDKQYPPLLLKLQRVLQLKGDAAKRYDRCDLLMLKGETHLQLKEQSLATAAFAEAIKSIDDQTDPKEAATARATALLVKRSRVFVFTPRTAPRGQAPKPISILDLDQRPVAFAAMFEDARIDTLAKLKTAKSAKTLLPIVEAVNAAADLRVLELASTGKDELSAAQLDGLAVQAKDLMTKGTKDMSARAQTINRRANELIRIRQNNQDGSSSEPLYYKRGLDPQLSKELKQIVDDSNRIMEAARQFAEISKATADQFGVVSDGAEKVAKSAQATLDDDYTGTHTGR